MKIKEQVVSLELAKKLKELGVKQESLWWWHIYKTADFCANQNNLVLGKPTFCGDNWADDYSAFTVAELLEIRFNQVGSFTILVDHYNRFADSLAKVIIAWLINNHQ